MKQRLAQLVDEFNRGVEQLETLDQQRAQLRDQLIRISGAIQVLRELCDESVADETQTQPPAASKTCVESNSDAA